MATLNIIGGGRVGRTLGRLWHEHGVFAIQDVLDRTPEGARAAITFVGAGRAAVAIENLRPADGWMLTLPDAQIAAGCEALVAAGLLRPGAVVFHCSGSLSSSELAAAAAAGAAIASIHPLKSFADPGAATAAFAGTWCAAEGDRAALELLRPAFERIGARVSEIAPEQKTLYHAASVIACNYLVALMEAGSRCYERTGLDREVAFAMMEPLARETLDNVFRLGTVRALTGPIARGDDAVVAGHLTALGAWDAGVGELYRRLGAVALELAREQGEASPEALARLAEVLRSY